MKLLILGHCGAVGKRYMAVARHFGIRHAGYDIANPCTPMPTDGITHALIATPTQTHYQLLTSLSTATDWHLMVEKPMTMDANEAYVMSMLRGHVVCNWSYVHADTIYKPGTCQIEYQSHHTGPHGVPWDTCQLHYLSALDTPAVIRESPIWGATINGRPVTYKDIEESYIRMLDAFVHDVHDGLWTLDDGYKMTLKCLEMV